MADLIINDVLHNGLTFKFYVPVEECPDIERFVDNYIRVTLSGTLEMIGCLKKVSSWSKKEKGEVVGIYKEITLLIECVTSKEGEVRLPDKKDLIMEEVNILYQTD